MPCIRKQCAKTTASTTNDKARSDAGLVFHGSGLTTSTPVFFRKEQHRLQDEVKKGKRHKNYKVLPEATTTSKNYKPDSEQKNNVYPCSFEYRLHSYSYDRYAFMFTNC